MMCSTKSACGITIIYNYLKNTKYCYPSKGLGADKDAKSTRVPTSRNRFRESMIGLCSFDLNSLYPHLIMQYNISARDPLGREGIPQQQLIKSLIKMMTFEMYKDNAVCANGAMYRKDMSVDSCYQN